MVVGLAHDKWPAAGTECMHDWLSNSWWGATLPLNFLLAQHEEIRVKQNTLFDEQEARHSGQALTYLSRLQ